MQPNFSTPGCTLLSNIQRKNPRKAQSKCLPIKSCNLYLEKLLHHQRYMFLLQLQLYVLTIIRVTQKPFRRKSTFCKFKNAILSKGYKAGVQRKSVLQALHSDCSEWAIHWSIVLARINLVSLYFRLFWYHSILRSSIDQKRAKTNEIWRQNKLSLVLIGLHDKWNRGNVWKASMISRSFQTVRRMLRPWKRETYVRSQSFSSETAVKYLHVGRRKIQTSPPLREQDQSNALPQG